MVVKTSFDNQIVVLKVLGRFDIHIYQEFERAYSKYLAAARCFQIDLSETSYMDSSALGMLLKLKDQVGTSADVELVNVGTDISHILEISQFNQLFKIR